MMPVALLDTDTLSHVIRRHNPEIARVAAEYVVCNGPFRRIPDLALDCWTGAQPGPPAPPA